MRHVSLLKTATFVPALLLLICALLSSCGKRTAHAPSRQDESMLRIPKVTEEPTPAPRPAPPEKTLLKCSPQGQFNCSLPTKVLSDEVHADLVQYEVKYTWDCRKDLFPALRTDTEEKKIPFNTLEKETATLTISGHGPLTFYDTDPQWTAAVSPPSACDIHIDSVTVTKPTH